MKVQDAPNYSGEHEHKIKEDTPCGCYFCLTIFPGSDIEEWVDGIDDPSRTALCPRCGIDAVLPDVTDEKFLKKAHEYWFTGKPHKNTGIN